MNNRNKNKNLIGKRITLPDGRSGIVTSAGYGLLSVDLDEGHWISGPAWWFGI